MNNHWVSHREYEFLSWDGFIPKEAIAGKTKTELMTSIERIVSSGEETGMLLPVLVDDYNASTGQKYMDYLTARADEGKRFSIRGGSGFVRPDHVSSSRICFFGADGTIEEREVSDMGKLIRELHPGESHIDYRYKGVHSPPLTFIFGPLTFVGDKFDMTQMWNIRVLLQSRTDVWFPRVISWWNLPDSEKYPDNSLLARCHTPRLNQFVKTVKDVVTNLGGTWQIYEYYEEEASPYYFKMLTDEGVRLEVDPKELE